MKADASADVEIQIGVMDAMKPPKRRHRVKQHVLRIDYKIEQDDGRRDSHPLRSGYVVEDTPASIGGNDCASDNCEGKDEPEQNLV